MGDRCDGKSCNQNIKKKSDYDLTGEEIGKIVTEKNQQYGNSFEDCEKYILLLYPNGIRPDQVGDVLYLARDFDKSKRIASGRKGDENPSMDKAGYAILDVVKQRKKENKKIKIEENYRSEGTPKKSLHVVGTNVNNYPSEYVYNTTTFPIFPGKISSTKVKEYNNPQIDAYTLAEFLNIDYKNAEHILELSKQPDGIELTMGGKPTITIQVITHREEDRE
jgi:hypothetical protein